MLLRVLTLDSTTVPSTIARSGLLQRRLFVVNFIVPLYRPSFVVFVFPPRRSFGSLATPTLEATTRETGDSSRPRSPFVNITPHLKSPHTRITLSRTCKNLHDRWHNRRGIRS